MMEKKEKEGEYWAKALIELVALKKENDTQTMLGYIKSGLELNTY